MTLEEERETQLKNKILMYVYIKKFEVQQIHQSTNFLMKVKKEAKSSQWDQKQQQKPL